MRLTTVILIASLLQVSASSLAQKITLSKSQAPLNLVFKELKAQSGYNFVYRDILLKKARPVSIKVKDVQLDVVLKMIFEDQPFTYEVYSETVIVKEKQLSIIDKIVARFQAIDVRGKILDENGQPLLGATVTIKGSNFLIKTGTDGSFSFSNVAENEKIVISYIGYQTIELTVAPDMGALRMKLSDSKLDEVQVQAYGQTSRRLNTGNIGTVKAADIAKQPVSNPLLALQGRVPGLFITQSSGLPNSTVQVKIRGTNSISQQTEPLYIIDGISYSSDMLLNVGVQGSGQSSPFSFINPSSIESIDVLKDADATAIYGSRGANGVIIITTKKGAAGLTKFDVNVYTGMSQIPRKLDLMNTSEFLTMRREAFKNDGLDPAEQGAMDLLTWDPSRNINWQDRLIGNTTSTINGELSMSGGSEYAQYRVFGGYNRVTPPFPGDFNSSKVSGGMTLSTNTANKRFHATIGVNYLSDQTYLPQYDPTANLRLAPNAPEPFNEDGSVNYTFNNPFVGFKNWYRGTTNNLITNGSISYNISSHLKFLATGGYNNSSVKGIGAITIASKLGDPSYPDPKGSADFSNSAIASWIVEPQLTYQGNFAYGKWEAMLGTTFQETKTNGQIVSGSGYSNDALLYSLVTAPSISNGQGIIEQSKFNSLYFRLNYNHQDKYLLNITGRRDGSSRFGPDKRFGNFGALGLGWIFTKEKFIEDHLSFLSFGKLRGSYGVTGNEPASNYRYLSLNSFVFTPRPYQNAMAMYPQNLLSPDFAWEQVNKAEIGLDLGFLRDRILSSVSVFKSQSNNQLIEYDLPVITGFRSVLVNRDAKVQNTGIELTLSTVNIRNSSFSWKSDFNFTVAKNKLLAYPGLETSPYATTLVIGEPLSVQRYYRAAGVNPEVGLYEFYTKDGDLTFRPDYKDDPTQIVNFDPKFYGGFQNSLTYKQFSLDVFFQFVKQKGKDYIFNNGSDPAGVSYGGANNQPREVLKRWQKPGDIATYQRYTTSASEVSDALFFQRESDATVVDASYIRLKNVSFSYQLPAKLTERFRIDKARVYFQAQNVFTFTKYKGLDPESQTYLPPMNVWTIGAQFIF